MASREHMSSCRGRHDDQGLCEAWNQLDTGDPNDVLVVSGQPCSGGAFGVYVLFNAYDLSEYDRIIKKLLDMRAAAEAAFKETVCEEHDWDCQPDEPE